MGGVTRRGFLNALLAGAAVTVAPSLTILPAEQPVLAKAVQSVSVHDLRAQARAALAAWFAREFDRILFETMTAEAA